MTPLRSKSVATWLAVAGGALGWHRWYLYGRRDWLAWAHWPPTLLGLAGVARMNNLGQDDPIAWLLIPLLGLMISQGMLCAITLGLTSDARWAQRYSQPPQATGWAPVLGAIVALLLGGTVLMGSIAFAGQRYFEWQQANPINENR